MEPINKENLTHLAGTIDALPELPKDFIRAVHITNRDKAEEIALTGLNYENHGMAMSTASSWSDPNKVEYGSDDPRFSEQDAKAVVIDMPAAEWKLHNDVAKSPGRIPAKYIVGIVNSVPKR